MHKINVVPQESLDLDKKTKTPSPFDKGDPQGPIDPKDEIQANGIMQNGLKEDPTLYG